MSQFEEYRKELKKSGLSTKDDLRKLLKPLIHDAVKFEPIKPKQPKNDSGLISNIQGLPYYEKDEVWPMEGNMKLDFVFQIIDPGNLNLPLGIKNLQFFMSIEGTFLESIAEGWHVKTFDKITPEKAELKKGPACYYSRTYREIKFSNVKTLPDWNDLDNYCPQARKLSCILDEGNCKINYNEVVMELIGEQKFLSTIGGYPKWVEESKTPKGPTGKILPLLFQLNLETDAGLVSNVNAYVEWAKVGQLYVFYDPDNMGHYEIETQDFDSLNKV